MTKSILQTAAAVLLLIGACLSSVHAVESEPPRFTGLTLEMEEDFGRAIVYISEMSSEFTFDPGEVEISEGRCALTPNLVITDDGITVDGVPFEFEAVRVEDVHMGSGSLISITFANARQTAAARRRAVSRNVIAVGRDVSVDPETFVRGDVLVFGGNVEIRGEVNRNVIAIFGEVFILGEGLIRGSAVAAYGKVNLLGEATLYGEVYSHEGFSKSDEARFSPDSEGWRPQNFDVDGHYNRVDGLFLAGRAYVADPDSLLPMIYAELGYAFEAERLRYDAGAHQRLFDRYSLTFGGHLFRRTSTDDDWLSPKWEATFLSLLAAEDPRDYYEEEGGEVYFTFEPGYHNEFGVSYAYTDLAWMDHHPKLFSIFGWDKEFRANFSSVPAEDRLAARDEFEGKLGAMKLWYTFDWASEEYGNDSRLWAHLEYLSAGDDLKGDHAFDRFTAEVRRYQPITLRQSVNVRLKYGIAGRDVPLFRKFYLGGWRTVRGLDHKSIYGEQMVLGNLEYVIGLPYEAFHTALLFDAGKVVSRDANIFSDGDFKSSVGLRVGLKDGLQVEVAKSLDDSDASAQIWVLFQRSF